MRSVNSPNYLMVKNEASFSTVSTAVPAISRASPARSAAELRVELVALQVLSVEQLKPNNTFRYIGNHYKLTIISIHRERKARETDRDLESTVER